REGSRAPVDEGRRRGRAEGRSCGERAGGSACYSGGLMTGMERRVFIAALAAGFLAVACSKSEPPPPPAPAPQVEAPPAPGVNDELKRLAREVYVYAYPLVLMDVTRQVATAKTPINTFQHKRAFPDPSATDIGEPNVDVLYSTAWLDLSNGPVILSVPDTKGR